MKKVSSKVAIRVEQLAPSGIRAFFDLVMGMKDVISLGVGEPDFVTPWHIREKAIYSLERGITTYTSNKGMPEVRAQICQFLKERHGLQYDVHEETLITVGVSEGLDLAVRAILNPGDKVLVPEPSYVSYGPIVELAGGKVVKLVSGIKDQFRITPAQLDQACKKNKIKAMVIGYPANPTGASYTKPELEALAKVIKKHDILVLSDEIYDELTYDFEHTSFAALPGMKNNVIYLNGFSKSYAMTGFRIGWACGPKDIIAAMTKIHQYTILCASITAQIAAQEALKNGAKSVQEMKREYARRRRYIVDALNEIGLTCHNPQGAFYVFPSIKITGQKSLDFAKDLLAKKKVALVPGVAFGPSCEGYVRISYASSYVNLKEAIARIADYLKERGISVPAVLKIK